MIQKWSQNAICVVETCKIPSMTNLAGKYVLLRIVTSTKVRTCDTKKLLNGNPILVSMASTQSTFGATNILYNVSEFFIMLMFLLTFSVKVILIWNKIAQVLQQILIFINSKPLSTLLFNNFYEDPIWTSNKHLHRQLIIVIVM